MQAGDVQTCPRRMRETGPWEHREGLDRWDTGGGLVHQQEAGLSCSFCGSLHPQQFMDLVGQGWIVEPTDKSYKAYLARPVTDTERDERHRRWLEHDPGVTALRQAGERAGKSAADITEDIDAYRASLVREPDGVTVAKFYYPHLDDAQRAAFIDLYNSRRMRLGYPGHFYVLPYFVRPAAQTGPAPEPTD